MKIKDLVVPAAFLIASALGTGCNMNGQLNGRTFSREETEQIEKRAEKCRHERDAFYDQVKGIYEGKTEQKVNVDGIDIKVGDLFKLTNGSWVEVMNLESVVNDKANTWVRSNAVEMKPKPVRHELGCGDYGDLNRCITDEGIIEVLGFTNDNLALVQYTPTGDYSGETVCPPGIQYFVSASKLAELKK